METQKINTNGLNLAFQEYPHDGETIIFLHFGGGNLMMWQRVIPYFQDQYRLILVDLRGHGLSDKPAKGYHMDEMAEDMLGLMDALEIKQAHIIGSSLGAEVGLALAANHPARVQTLVCDGALSNQSGEYGTWEGTEDDFDAHRLDVLNKILSNPQDSFPTVEDYVKSRQAIFEKYGWWNEYFVEMEKRNAMCLEDGSYTKAFGKELNAAYMGHYFNYRFEDYYEKVTCPILWLAEKDSEDVLERKALEHFLTLTEQGEIANLDGWAHPYLWLLDPEDACRVVLAFLDEKS